MAYANARVGLVVNFVSFHDDELPGTNITDTHDPRSFVLTTGAYPHEVVVGTRASSARLSRVVVVLHDAKDIAIDKATLDRPGDVYETIATRTLSRGSASEHSGQQQQQQQVQQHLQQHTLPHKDTQVVLVNLDPQSSGRNVRALRLRILSGYSEFVGIYSIAAWGEESQQRVAVLESKPEVNIHDDNDDTMTSILDVQPPIEPIQRAMIIAKDSTMSTALMNVVAGYVMGFGFSLFGAMISMETATQSMGARDFFRHSLTSAGKLGCSFTFFGFLFGGIEVALEKRRGRKDALNPTISGGLIGGAYGWRSYKYPGLVAGVVGGAALSLVFERMMDKMGFAQR